MATWILVASATRARVFEVERPGGRWHEIMDFVDEKNRWPSAALVSDRDGRVIAAARGQRQTFAPSVDLKQEENQRFARDIVKRLDFSLSQHLFDKLVLIAPPRFLGQLRDAMGSRLASFVSGELGRDLTREEPQAMPGHLKGLCRAMC